MLCLDIIYLIDKNVFYFFRVGKIIFLSVINGIWGVTDEVQSFISDNDKALIQKKLMKPVYNLEQEQNEIFRYCHTLKVILAVKIKSQL